MASLPDVMVICAAIPREEVYAQFVVRLLRRYRTPRRLLQAQPDLRPRLSVALATVGDDSPEATLLESCRYLVPVLSSASGARPEIGACIEQFLGTHPVDHVLPVALEPNLRACLPETLLARVLLPGKGEEDRFGRIDLMIVDSSAPGSAGRRRRLRREQLRLLAPLVGTRLAALQERERERRFRRLRRGASAVGILLAAFAGIIALSTFRVDWRSKQIGAIRREDAGLANPSVLISILPRGRILTLGFGSASVWSSAGQRLYSGPWSAAEAFNAGRYLLVGNSKDRQEYALDLRSWQARPTGYYRSEPAAVLEGRLVGPDELFLSLTAVGGRPCARLFSLEHQREVALLKLPLTTAQYTVASGRVTLTQAPNSVVLSNAILTAGGRLLLQLPRALNTLVWTLWDVQLRTQLAVLASGDDALTSGMAVSEPAALIATTEADALGLRNLCTWGLTDGRPHGCKALPNFSGVSSPDLRFADRGARLIVPNGQGGPGSGSGGAWIYSLHGTDLALKASKAWRRYSASSPGAWAAVPGTLLLLSSAAHGAELWEVAETSRHLTLPGFRLDGLSSLSMSPDHRFLCVQRAAGLELWDLSRQQRVASLPAVEPGLQLAFTVDGTGLIRFGQGLLSMWDLASGRQLAQELRLPGTTVAIARTGKGAFIAWQESGEVLRFLRRPLPLWLSPSSQP